jgi:YfiR/HmsC-like
MALLSREWLVACGTWFVPILAAALVCVPRPAAPQGTVENDVKAAYLFNFTKFVRWPVAADVSNEFRICVVGDQAFAASLDAIIKGESADGRPLVRHEPASVDTARGCQILFIGREASPREARLLPALRDLPVLTVGDAPTFLAQGGAIRFVRTGDRLRFDVNIAAAARARLDISSKLLRVARKVEGTP